MAYFKGVNLLPQIKHTQVQQYSRLRKRLLKYSIWLLVIILVNVASYIPVSLEKIKLVNLNKEKKLLVAQIKKDQTKYIKYHNLVFRLTILENIKRSRFYLSQLVQTVDDVVAPSISKQYTIRKDGSVTIGLQSDSFTNASISWHKLLVKEKLFKTLSLSSFSNQNGNVPFILKGQVNIKFIQNNEK